MSTITLNVVHSLDPVSLEALKGLFPGAAPAQPQSTPLAVPTPPPAVSAMKLPAAAPVPPTSAAPQQSTPLPTSEPTYTHDQISLAAAVFAEGSEAKRQQVHGLLAQFGVQTLFQLPVDQLGAFATALRAAGANI